MRSGSEKRVEWERRRILARIRESVWLDAKPEEVWPFLVEPEKKLQWLTEIHEQEWIDGGPAGVGTRFYVQKEIRGSEKPGRALCERVGRAYS